MKLYCLTILFSCISYFSIAQTAYTNEVSLGSNTNAYIPYTGAYTSNMTVRSSATEAIYQVSEFTTSPLGIINEISMYKRSNNTHSGTLSIFLKETTNTTVGTTASTAGYTLVYRGAPPSGDAGWRSVTFNGDDFSGADLEGAASGASEFLWEKNNISVLMIFTHSGSSQAGLYHSGISTSANHSASRWISATSNHWQNNARTMARPFHKAAIGLTVISPLPVELTTFTAHSVDGGGGELRWTTKSELNNDYYTLYHSVDGINFDVIETLSGAGSSDVEIEYVYHHRKPARKSIEYYKLRQTDYDGQYKEFGPISIYHDLILDKVFPNPANSIITVISEFNFKVYNALGKEVSIFQLSEDSYDISHLDSGVYFINFENGNKELLVKKSKN